MNSKMRKELTCQCEHEATSTHSRTFAVVSRKPLNNRNLSHIKTFEITTVPLKWTNRSLN